MTRPRSQQILDLQTRFSRLQYDPTPGAVSDNVALATVYGSTVTDLTGGVEESIWAFVESSSSAPYPILAGDAITVTVDAGSPVNVTFAGTDTTSSRIAARINTAVGSTVAFDSGSRLFLHGVVIGAAGKIVLADFVPGTLAKLGLVAGTYNGVDAPQRGILTRSLDGRGGTALLKTLDGQDILTDASASILIGEGLIPPVRMLEIPGGVPVHARILDGGANLTLEYFARMPIRPEVATFNSNFALLDGTDTITFTVTDPDFGSPVVIVVTFPAGPGLTRDQVVTRINDLWADALTLTLSGAAHVTGTVSQPYTFSGISTIDIAVDGGAPTSVDLSTALTAADAATLINTAVPSVTASAVVSSNGTFLRIRSNNADGTTSSIELRPPAGGLTDAFQVLGLVPGKYRGYFLCQPFGVSEIKFFGLGRGAQAAIAVSSGNPTTLTRMGLPAGTYRGLDEGEQAVRFPVMSPAGASEPVLALIPEVMDFGEVPIPAESTLAKFVNRSTGLNQVQAAKLYSIDGLRIEGQGIDASGRPAALGPDGLLPSVMVSPIRSEYENFFKKFIRGDFYQRNVTAIVTNQIEGGGASGNTSPASDTFIVDVDPTDAFTGAARLLQVRFGRDGTPFDPFHVSGLAAAVDGVRWLVEVRDTGGQLSALANSAGPLRVYDANTSAAGIATTGKRVIPVTSAAVAQGDDTLRIMGKREGNLEAVSLFRQVNAKWVTTVGDGVNSFGDFNGTNAIQQAITFFNTHIGIADSTLRIQVKRGGYVVSGGNRIEVPSDTHLILEGEGREAAVISVTDATVPAIRADSNCHLELRDIGLLGSGFDLTVQIKTTSKMTALDSRALRTHIQFDDGYAGHFERCLISSSSSASPLISVLAGDGITKDGFTFLDCELIGGNSLPILKVGASALIGYTLIKRISFVRNKIRCGSTTIDANSNLVGNSGVIDVDPGSAGGSLGAFAGPYLRRVEWLDCDVTCDRTAGTTSILMHLLPVANGVYTTAASFDITVNSAMRIDQVIIDGGHWVVPRDSTVINPFTIGLAVTATSTDGKEFGRVSIKNWRFEFDTEGIVHNSQGAPTQDVDSFFTTPLSTESGHPLSQEWGAVAISAMDLVMKDCELLGFNQNGDSGDLFLKADRRADIDNILIDKYQTGNSSGVPNQRVRTRFGTGLAVSRGFPNVSMRRVVVHGTDATLSVWCNNAIWLHEPSATPVLIKDSEIDNFQVGGANNNRRNFQVVDVGQNGLWGTLNGNTGTVDRLTLDNFACRQGTYGITINRIAGIDFLRRIVLRNCQISDHTSRGIEVTSIGIGIGALSLLNNHVNNNNPGGGLDGVGLFCGDWIVADPDVDPAFLTVVGNQIYDNTGSVLGVQMQIGSLSAGTDDPVGIVIGNNFSSNGIDGQFEIYRSLIGVPTALSSNQPATVTMFRGVETGYEGETAAGNNRFRYFVSGNQMIQNCGRLLTP